MMIPVIVAARLRLTQHPLNTYMQVREFIKEIYTHTLFRERKSEKNLNFHFFAVFGVRPQTFFLTGQEHVGADCYEAGITNFDPLILRPPKTEILKK